MSYKVLRLMEYTYPDVETADSDMQHWSVPPIGSFGALKGTIIRSTIIQHPGEEEE